MNEALNLNLLACFHRGEDSVLCEMPLKSQFDAQVVDCIIYAEAR